MAKKKNGRGEGTFRIKSNGNIEYRISYKDEFGQTQRKSFTGYDEDDCLYKAERFIGQEEKRQRGIDVKATIPEIVKIRYKSDLEKNYVGEQGYSRNIGTLGIIERSMIGNIPIAELTEFHIDVFLRSITSYSNSVIGKVYQQMRMAFSIALEKRIIEKNLMLSRDLRCPKSDKPDKKVRGFTEEEQNIFIEAVKSYKVPKGRNNYKLQLLIELFSGMRMGEINALKPENIDFKKRIVYVTSTVSRGLEYRDFIKEGTKTYAGMREIPMNKMLEQVLSEAMQNMRKNPEGLIFYDYNKKSIIATSQVNCFFRRLCEKNNLKYNGQHSLRHTFATRCIEAGIPPVVLKNWLGHKDIHITLDTYADVFDRMNFGAIEKLEEYIGNFEDKQDKLIS